MKKEHTFKSIFGSAWNNLPPAFQKRYMNRSYTHDITTVEGKMDIHFSKIMSYFVPFFKWLHVLVPYQGNNIPVKVDFRNEIHSDAVYLDRKFYFPGKAPYEFNSCMRVFKNNEVIEYMSFGIGWRIHYFYDGKKIVMQHKGYIWKVFGLNIPMPFAIFIGIGRAEEEIIDDNSYRVTMTISHPLFGSMYSYSGDFTFKSLPT